MLLISRKGNPDGSLSNYPSLRILWPEELFDSLNPWAAMAAQGVSISTSTFICHLPENLS